MTRRVITRGGGANVKRAYARHLGGTVIEYDHPCGHVERVDHGKLPVHRRMDEAACRFMASRWSKEHGGVSAPCPTCAKEERPKRPCRDCGKLVRYRDHVPGIESTRHTYAHKCDHGVECRAGDRLHGRSHHNEPACEACARENRCEHGRWRLRTTKITNCPECRAADPACGPNSNR